MWKCNEMKMTNENISNGNVWGLVIMIAYEPKDVIMAWK
jgi:hypothetical protein